MKLDEVLVEATAKGYHIGPREVGNKFAMPRGKNGELPKASWFKVIRDPKAEAEAKVKAEAEAKGEKPAAGAELA